MATICQKFSGKEFHSETPTLKDVSASLGAFLAEVVFNYSHKDTKKVLKLVPAKYEECEPLSSSDLHTVPRTTRGEFVKSNVHAKILELGGKLLKQFEAKVKAEAEENAQYQINDILRMCCAEKKKERESTLLDLHRQYEDYIKIVQQELENTLENEWKNMVMKFNKKLQKSIIHERAKVTREFLTKMRTEISYIISELYNEFEQHFRAQRETIIADFNEIMRRQEIKYKEAINKLEEAKNRDLQVQRTELSLQNNADAMYLLCLERLRSDSEKHAMHTFFEKEITKLESVITELKDAVQEMQEKLVKQEEEKRILENQLCKYNDEFRSLVYFVLNAMPEQAEFVLRPEIIEKRSRQ